MRITNLLHFTENHRFNIYREFSLSSLDYKMLSHLYQPMLGSLAISLYQVLFQQLPADRTGYSALEQQRKLFYSLSLEPNELGRKTLIEQTSLLEAVGLLQTVRKYLTDDEDYIYEYQLQPPLSPADFYRTQHLVLLLRDKVGKHMVVHLKEQLDAEQEMEIKQQQVIEENISVPFYDLFQLNTKIIDVELEQALAEMAPARAANVQPAEDVGFLYSDILMRFPRDSMNRAYIEQLKDYPEQLGMINYVAKKYNLTLQETCRLLDEDHIFTNEGMINLDVLQHRANMNYRQDEQRQQAKDRFMQRVAQVRAEGDQKEQVREDEVAVEMEYYLDIPPIFYNQCNIHQYNMLLRNEPYTHVLKRFFPGAVPDHVSKIFEKIDLNYRLKEEVINVLIHYLNAYNLSWSSGFIDSVAADMLGKQVDSYEKAVQYIRDKRDYHQGKTQRKGSAKFSTGSRGKAVQKPQIPYAAVEDDDLMSEEEHEELLRLAQQIERMEQ